MSGSNSNAGKVESGIVVYSSTVIHSLSIEKLEVIDTAFISVSYPLGNILQLSRNQVEFDKWKSSLSEEERKSIKLVELKDRFIIPGK